MKICLITNLYEPFQRGGAEVVVKRIADGLRRLDHDVFIITVGRRRQKVEIGGQAIYHVVPFNIFSFLDINRMPFVLRAFWHIIDVFNFSGASQVKKILIKERPDVILSHNLKGISFLLPKVIKKIGIKHIYTLHDVQLSRPSGLVLYGHEKPFLVLDKVYEKICRWLFSEIDVVVSPSKWLMNYYLKRGFFRSAKKEIMPNPVILKKVDKFTKHLAKPDYLSLLYVGQLASSKGVEFMIETLKKNNSVDWHLKIIGDGPIREKLKDLAGDDKRFEFLGKLPSDQLPNYYRQADFTVIPSLCYENSPTVIFESLIANTPVIASDIGGISEVVKDEYNGFTFVPGNEKNLLEILQYFLNHREKINELRRNCFVSVRNYSLNIYLKRLLSF